MSKEKQKLSKLYKWFRTLRRAEPIFYRPFFPYKMLGVTKPFDDRSYIFVGNHLSILDVVFPAVSTHRPLHYMAKKSLFEKGLMKKFVTKCECIPVNRDGSVLDFCRLHDITIQPWSPFQYGFFEGVFIGSEKYPALNETLNEIAGKYGVSPMTVSLAWILRHPAKMQPVIGTMNEGRLKECLKAADITLTREEWYQIYLSAGNELP